MLSTFPKIVLEVWLMNVQISGIKMFRFQLKFFLNLIVITTISCQYTKIVLSLSICIQHNDNFYKQLMIQYIPIYLLTSNHQEGEKAQYCIVFPTWRTWMASPHWSLSYSDEMRKVWTEPVLLDILNGRFGDANTSWASNSASFFRCFSLRAKFIRPA